MRWQLPAALALAVLAHFEASAFMHSDRKLQLRELTRNTFLHAYGSYKRVAFPADEVLPLSCKGQGHDREHRDNVAVNDVMGDYVLTLVDTLDTFALMGDRSRFEEGVREVIQYVNFDRDSRVQVFEVTIRMLGGLLSGHLLASSKKKETYLPWYKGELLTLAHDLGKRLLPAFNTPTGIPWPRQGVFKGETTESCAAAAGSLVLEFVALSRLTGEPVFERVAKKAFFATWNRKSELDLLGNTINVATGKWLHGVSSTGAGIDSFFEYAAKTYIMLGEDDYWRVWDDAYAALMRHVRAPDGFWYRGASMYSGLLASVLVDSLSAFFPGVQTLVGDLESAIKSHAVYAFQWKRYGGLPELFDINKRVGVSMGYPLRPEFIESNLYLYRSTKDEFYLEIAEQVLHDINNRTRVECGLAAILDLNTGLLEDKQPSFVTSETLKYLYLTFDENNPIHADDSNAVFSTEGHLLDVDTRPDLRRKRKSTVSMAFSCPAYEPMAEFSRTQHFLSQSVSRRVDFEYARYLAGYVIDDEAKEVAEGRWSESGWCARPVQEEYGIELLFAAPSATEDVSPKPEKVFQHPDGSVTVRSIRGLRFGLIRSAGEGFVITKVAGYRVPPGAFVHISDPQVLASVPPKKVQKVHLEITVETADGSTHLDAAAQVANFGPSPVTKSASPNTFSTSLPPLPLVTLPFHFGCDPHVDDPVAVEGKVLVLRRGLCSFALKSHLAALAGAKGVIVINNEDDERGLVPSASREEEELPGLVPLLLVSNATGRHLEALLERSVELGSKLGGGQRGRGRGQAVVRPVVVDDSVNEEVEPLMLGGYVCLNVRLKR